MADQIEQKTGLNDPETNPKETSSQETKGPATKPGGSKPGKAAAETAKAAASNPEEVKERVKADAQELEKGYEQARRELDDVVGRLRTEVQRLHLEESGAKTRAWVESNPTLAIGIALGGGVLVGRLLKKAITPEVPPTLKARARTKAGLFATAAGTFAHGLGDAVSDQARVTSKQVAKARKNAEKELRKRSSRLSKEAGKISGGVSKAGSELFTDLATRTRQLSDDLAHYAAVVGEDVGHRSEAFGDELSKRATGIAKSVSHAAGDAAGTAQETGHHVSKALKKQSKSLKKQSKKSADYSDTLVAAFKTALAAVLVKRVNNLVHRIS